MTDSYQITLGVQLTRRKFVHEVRDPQGSLVFVERSIGKVFDWLADNDIEGAVVEAPRSLWDVSLAKRAP